MADWFDENAPQQANEDWFAQNAPQVATEERSIPSKIGHAVVDTLKSFVPQSFEEAALVPVKALPGVGKVGTILSNIAFGKPIAEGLDPLAGIPVVQRIPQIMEAEKTPAGSQERFTTAAGTLLDLGMIAGLKAAPEIASKPKPLAEVAGIAKPEPAIAPEPPLTAEAEATPIAPEVAQPVPEGRITAAAVRDAEGNVYTGRNHPEAAGTGEALKFEQDSRGTFSTVLEAGDLKQNRLRFTFEPVPSEEGAYKIDFANIGKTRDPETAFRIFREHLPNAVDQFSNQFNPKTIYALAATDARFRLYGRLLKQSGVNAEPIQVLSHKGYKITLQPNEVTKTQPNALPSISSRETPTGEPNALQEPSTGEILQRQPEETGATGSERVGVEPSVQGEIPAETLQTAAPKAEVAAVQDLGGSGATPATKAAGTGDVARPEPQVPQTFSVQMPTDTFGTEHTPVSSALHEMGGVLSKSGAKKVGKLEGNADLWDDVQSLSHPTHNKIYGTEMPDVAAQTLYDAGLISDPSVQTMWKAVADESKSSRNILKSQKGEIETQKFKLQETSKQAQDFGKAQQKGWKEGDPVVPVRDLQVGDQVTVGGEKLKVIDIDPDSFDVTLEDGKKYGVQTVKDNTVIYGEHEAPAVAPRLLSGETQGDLISSTQKEPFALVGEKGTDFGAQQAATEKATSERAQSEKGQLELGQKPPPPTEPPVVTESGASGEPHVSAIANKFTEERTKSGELGEIAPGQGYSTKELANAGLKMTPEQINQHVSDLMNDTGNPIEQGKAVRAEEARLSQRSNELSRAAADDPTNVQAKLDADNAFKDVTDFHNGPVAKLKQNWHAQGMGLQGELPVDLGTFNGLREAWLRDNGKVPSSEVEPKLRKMAEDVTKSVSEDNGAKQKLGQEISKATAKKNLPTYDEVRNNIMDRIKEEPCRT